MFFSCYQPCDVRCYVERLPFLPFCLFYVATCCRIIFCVERGKASKKNDNENRMSQENIILWWNHWKGCSRGLWKLTVFWFKRKCCRNLRTRSCHWKNHKRYHSSRLPCSVETVSVLAEWCVIVNQASDLFKSSWANDINSNDDFLSSWFMAFYQIQEGDLSVAVYFPSTVYIFSSFFLCGCNCATV